MQHESNLALRDKLLAERLRFASLHRSARQHIALSALIGFIGVVWSLAGLWRGSHIGDWQYITAMHGTQGSLWLLGMFGVGVLQFFGCFSRDARHISYALGFMVWSSVFGMFLLSGLFVPLMALPFVLACFCAGAYWDEVYSRIRYAIGGSCDFFSK